MPSTTNARTTTDTLAPKPASPELLSAVLDSVECGVMVHGRGAELLSINRSAREMLSLTDRDLRGQLSFGTHWKVVDQDGHPIPIAQQPSVTAAATGKPVHNMVMGIHLTHSQIWLQVSAVPELDTLGRVHRVVVTLVDITQWHQAQQRRRQERVLMEEVFRTVSTGVVVIDADGTICHSNAAAERMLGLPTESYPKDHPHHIPGQFTHPDGSPVSEQERPSWLLFHSNDGLSDAHFRWMGPSGRRRIFSMNGTRLPCSKSGPHRAVLTFQDITLQAADSRACRHTRHRLHAALRAANLGRIDIQLDSQRVSVDGVWIQHQGLPTSWTECDLNRWIDHIEPTDLERVRAQWIRHLKGEQDTFAASVWVNPPKRTRMRMQVTGQVDKRDATGRAIRMSGVLRDVTQEHAAREATQRMEDNAAELARLEGTAAVAGGVAHTFSNLLGGVLGAVSSLEEQAQHDPSLVEGLSLIRDASEHAGRLTKQLRGLSGHGRFRMDIADLHTCVHEMQDLLNTAVAEQAQVEVEHIGPPSSVKVDTDQLQQVAVNLVLNAAESDPRPTPRVVVRTRSIHIRPGESLYGLASPQGPAPGRYALVEVIDEGCGMTQAVRQRMFEPFFSTRVGRAGLGLSAVLGIIRGHGGHVAVQSKPGLGTTITLVLPETTQATPVVNPPSPPPMVSDTPDRPPQVLVADDEPVIRRLVERVLVRCRYGVECVSDGQQAVDVLAQRREDIDLLLVDLTMPGMSGHEVLALTRREWPDLPVIVMSGYTQREVSGPLAADPSVGFIEKPFTAAQLRERINALLPARAANK